MTKPAVVPGNTASPQYIYIYIDTSKYICIHIYIFHAHHETVAGFKYDETGRRAGENCGASIYISICITVNKEISIYIYIYSTRTISR